MLQVLPCRPTAAVQSGAAPTTLLLECGFAIESMDEVDSWPEEWKASCTSTHHLLGMPSDTTKFISSHGAIHATYRTQ